VSNEAKEFQKYLEEINKAYARGDATEHTHRPALKTLVEMLGKNITATNEPKRIQCGAPDFAVSISKRKIYQTIGYIECKDIGKDLNKEAKNEQIKERYLKSFDNFILTDYIEFRLYIKGEKQFTTKLAEEKGGKFKLIEDGAKKVSQLLRLFIAQEPLKITSAKELTVKMGDIAKFLRDIINKTFNQEIKTGTLHSQYEAFKEVLIHDLTEEQFADMYSQTICYGLFSARCHLDDITLFGKDKHAVFHGMDHRSKEFTRKEAAFLLPKTNPFLRKTFGHIVGPELDERIAWLVDDLVALLRNADMSSVLRDFAKKTKRRDPVFHFYETFLAEYDKKLKKSRGVYYTPDEVVSYIVRSVDILLKEKFGLKRGLADDSKIKGTDRHKLLILDPAVGTGTFLYEVINQIHERFKRQKGTWSSYVKDHLLPRIFGFELMMAPYTICHMKLGLELDRTGYEFDSDERLGVYLTNTLEEAEEKAKNLFAQWISEEAREANRIKKDLPIMIVLGNPPYERDSKNNNDFTDYLLKPFKDYVKNERNIQPLNNDYIKFIGFGIDKIIKTGNGILAFITASSYLSGSTIHSGLRKTLNEIFDEIYILNLYGDIVGKEKDNNDENIFCIQEGVAIFIGISTGKKKLNSKIHYNEILGKRNEKYNVLNTQDVSITKWENIKSTAPQYFFVPKKFKGEDEYNSYLRITKIFGFLNEKNPGIAWANGVKTNNNKLFVDIDLASLKQRMETFVDRRFTDEQLKARFGLSDGKYWNTNREREKAKKAKMSDNFLKYNFRPFDLRIIYYQPNLIEIGRGGASKNVMKNMQKENIGLVINRTISLGQEVSHFLCIKDLMDVRFYPDKKGVPYLFPLYLYSHSQSYDLFDNKVWPTGKNGRVPNLNKKFVNEFAAKVKLDFVSDGRGDLINTFGPEDIFHYIYAVLYSPEYRKRFAEFLKIDFPRIPFPASRIIFKKLCKVGSELSALHLMESEILEDEKRWPRFDIEGTDEVVKGYPKYVAHSDKSEKGRVFINKDQYFEGINPVVWEFHIGGYQVCEKWLKDRRERILSYDDITHYQKITVALSETIRLMQSPCLFEMYEEKK